MQSFAGLMIAFTAALAAAQSSESHGHEDSMSMSLPYITSSIPIGIPPAPTQTGCPTITATRELCTTCAVPACLALATVTQHPCDCPAEIPTVYLDFPCSGGCSGIFCSTSYDVVTATGSSCGTPTIPSPTPRPSLNGTFTTGGPPTGGSQTSSVPTGAAGRVRPFRLWL